MQTITINRNNNKKMKNRGVIKGYKRGLFFQNYMEYLTYIKIRAVFEFAHRGSARN